MRSTRVSGFLALSLLSLLCLSSALRAERDEMLRVWIEPGRDHWVQSPLLLKFTFTGITNEALNHVDAKTLKIRIDGHDVTDIVFREAFRQGKARFKNGGRELELAFVTGLSTGKHDVDVSYKTRLGGGPTFKQSFRVYDPETVLKGLGFKRPKNQVGAANPLLVTLPPQPVAAPPVWLSPADKAFTGSRVNDLRVEWARNGAGIKLGGLKILLDNVDVTSSFTQGRDSALWKARPLTNGKHTLVAQVTDTKGNLRVTSSTFLVYDQTKRVPFIFAPTNTPSPLAHTHQQFQYYGGSPYFHHGVDLRKPSGSKVYAADGGKITNFYWYGRKPYYFEMEITDAWGYRWQYHHIDEPKIPSTIRQIAARKGSVSRGTWIGQNVYWPVKAYGSLFHHIHLNVIGPDGRYVNPLNLMLALKDSTPPSVLEVYILKNLGSSALNSGGGSGATVGGKLDFIAKAQDTIAGQPYLLCVYKMSFEVKELSGTRSHHVPETKLWKFDSLPGGGNRYANVWDIHKQSFWTGTKNAYTRGDYNYHEFYYNLTSHYQNGVNDSKGYWDSGRKDWEGKPLFPNGQYRLIVRAYDIRGNVGSKSITFTLKN